MIEGLNNLPFAFRTFLLIQLGRIHGYPSRVRVGRGSDGEGHWSIWAGAMSSKRSKTPKGKMGIDRPTDQLRDKAVR